MVELSHRATSRDAFAMVEGDEGLNAPHHQVLRAEVIKAYGGKLGLLAAHFHGMPASRLQTIGITGTGDLLLPEFLVVKKNGIRFGIVRVLDPQQNIVHDLFIR
jgi:hypothetical protein